MCSLKSNSCSSRIGQDSTGTGVESDDVGDSLSPDKYT